MGDVAESLLIGKFIALNAYIRKKQRPKIDSSEMQEQQKSSRLDIQMVSITGNLNREKGATTRFRYNNF